MPTTHAVTFLPLPELQNAEKSSRRRPPKFAIHNTFTFILAPQAISPRQRSFIVLYLSPSTFADACCTPNRRCRRRSISNTPENFKALLHSRLAVSAAQTPSPTSPRHHLRSLTPITTESSPESAHRSKERRPNSGGTVAPTRSAARANRARVRVCLEKVDVDGPS